MESVSMRTLTFQISLCDRTASNAFPLTRARVIELVKQNVPEPLGIVRVVVTTKALDDEFDTELASVELVADSHRAWQLQYVSHPEQSNGLTAGALPCEGDFASYAHAYVSRETNRAFTGFIATTLQAEGLGPIAVLDLRRDNAIPVVPDEDDVRQLVSFLE
ncbi:hypothetical protein [Robbsia sp. KACC 23696]|uniref:hypothetical protein n=1 Tax=Robbsia sp. KACC 23696 TaxID=3149231 RepID=UPI00325AEF75